VLFKSLRIISDKKRKMLTIFWLENLKGRVYLEDVGVDGKIILEWILGKWMGSCGPDTSGSE
jgi:hypothetical protein